MGCLCRSAAAARRRDSFLIGVLCVNLASCGADAPTSVQSWHRHTEVLSADAIQDYWHEVCMRHVSKGNLPRNASAMKRFAKKYGFGPAYDWARVVSVYDFDQWVDEYGLRHPRRLVKLEEDAELRLVKPVEVVERAYHAPTGENDLHKPLPGVVNASLIILGQTLEHLYDPGRAMGHLVGVLEEGGYIFANVPMNNVPHGTPHHFYHFTPMGLVLLMRLAGLQVLEVGWWGSEEYEMQMFSMGYLQRMSWPGYGRLKNLAGDSDRACLGKDALWDGHIDQVWALARKPSA